MGVKRPPNQPPGGDNLNASAEPRADQGQSFDRNISKAGQPVDGAKESLLAYSISIMVGLGLSVVGARDMP